MNVIGIIACEGQAILTLEISDEAEESLTMITPGNPQQRITLVMDHQNWIDLDKFVNMVLLRHRYKDYRDE